MTGARTRRTSLSARVGVTHASEERTADGVYGVIVSAAVMVASHAATAVALVLAVLVTLLIYWSAERYCLVVAERIHTGHRPTWHQVRRRLAAGWGMVTASAAPLGVLMIVYWLGFTLDAAVTAALTCSTLLLCLAGWEVGRHHRLTSLERLVSAAVSGAFGAALIMFKIILH